MGINERRQREREDRRRAILDAAWQVAEELGWAVFSVERVASRAELGRATVYGYFENLDVLVHVLAQEALDELQTRLAAAPGLAESLDVPVRLAQSRPAAFALLFDASVNPKPVFATAELTAIRTEAREVLGRLRRLGDGAGALSPDAVSAAAFVTGISMAGALVPELRSSTPLRRRWQGLMLGDPPAPEPAKTPKKR
ncbi:MAG: TetR/AcrR family transcriptional regulator [Myxococcales bacterium]|nr:TetR/AcrR family transcriptional regulator [Myxococcales bacterium]